MKIQKVIKCEIIGPTRMKERIFKCGVFGLKYNRYFNGAVNIGNRLSGYMLKARRSGPANSPSEQYPEREHNGNSVFEGRSSIGKGGVVHYFLS